jgi:hypothetical protein
MHVCTRRVECDLHVVGGDLRQQTVDAIGRRLETVLASLRETVGRGIDADHPDRTDPLAAQGLEHQIGADVPGPDQCCVDPRHDPLDDARDVPRAWLATGAAAHDRARYVAFPLQMTRSRRLALDS